MAGLPDSAHADYTFNYLITANALECKKKKDLDVSGSDMQ